jgi:hypothetical protein
VEPVHALGPATPVFDEQEVVESAGPETASDTPEEAPMPWDAHEGLPRPVARTGEFTGEPEVRLGDDEPWAMEPSDDVRAAGESTVGRVERGELELEPLIALEGESDEEPLDLEILEDDEPEIVLEEIGLETRFLEPLPEGAIPVQAPLSPWDIPDSEDDDTAGQPTSRAARARAEWEALGEALAASIGGEDASVFESAMQALAEGIAASDSTSETPGVTREIIDIADRIAYFASRLRSDGYRAITNAQARGDRLDIALAGLAAGFLAGQHE